MMPMLNSVGTKRPGPVQYCLLVQSTRNNATGTDRSVTQDGTRQNRHLQKS